MRERNCDGDNAGMFEGSGVVWRQSGCVRGKEMHQFFAGLE